MSWTRLDDTWTDLPELAALPYAVRWHYLAVIQFCSRTGRVDGELSAADARRCSDVKDPAAVLSMLTDAGLLELLPGQRVKVVRITDHVPPPSVRNASEAAKLRKRRQRAHKDGDHSMCVAGNCPQAPGSPPADPVTGEVTSDVTRDTGTGRDGTGTYRSENENSESSSWPTVVTPGSARAGVPCPGCQFEDCEGECVSERRASA